MQMARVNISSPMTCQTAPKKLSRGSWLKLRKHRNLNPSFCNFSQTYFNPLIVVIQFFPDGVTTFFRFVCKTRILVASSQNSLWGDLSLIALRSFFPSTVSRDELLTLPNNLSRNSKNTLVSR